MLNRLFMLCVLSAFSVSALSCYEPLGSSALVEKRSSLSGVCGDASSVEIRLLKSGEVEYTPIEGSTQVYEESESLCDGVDNDCDGIVDEVPGAPDALKQSGVCAGLQQACDGSGGWTEPDYTSVDGYGDELCDGLDNDCDGSADEDVTSELADTQAGVCSGAMKQCRDGAWVEPDYALLSGYALNDSPCDGVDNDCDGRLDEGTADDEVCDGVDNDCDGSTDEGVLNACGECGAVPAETCDGADNDCDGSTDEELDAPLAENQVGVCEGALQSCVSGDWVSDYAGVSEYEAGVEQSLSDGLDNNCNGDVDEDLRPCAPNCPDLDFVRIEGGSFMMGDQRSSPDSNELPVHNVNVPRFEMMRTEITVAQYRACVNASVCSTPRTGSNYTWSSNPSDQEDHPINGVSWYQLMEFAAWVGARLPTEAEWEYAARGQGQDIIYPWGDDSPTCSLANYSDCVTSTSPVCSTSGGNTSQGLCDMAGNVYEWVQDEWHSDYYGAPSDGSGWCSGICPVNASDSNYNASDSAYRVRRGGGWDYDASSLRAAFRDFSAPAYQNRHDGGRLARTLP